MQLMAFTFVARAPSLGSLRCRLTRAADGIHSRFRGLACDCLTSISCLQKGVRERRGDVRDRLLGSPQMLVALFIFVCVAEAGTLGQSGLFRSPRYAFRITPACGKRLPLITFRIPGVLEHTLCKVSTNELCVTCECRRFLLVLKIHTTHASRITTISALR